MDAKIFILGLFMGFLFGIIGGLMFCEYVDTSKERNKFIAAGFGYYSINPTNGVKTFIYAPQKTSP